MTDKWEELASLDELILSATAESAAAGGWLDRRGQLIERIVAGAPTFEELEELAERNRRLTEWVLHWRRVALIESAELEQHLRFVRRTGELPGAEAGLEVLG